MRSPLLQLFQHQATGSLRERLCTTLRLAISRHHLHAGQQLPSTRQLAQDLNLSRVTAEAAYGQLESEGYLRRETGRGSFVAITMPDVAPLPALHRPAGFSARGQQVLATPEQPRAAYAWQCRDGLWRSVRLSALTPRHR